MSTNSRNEILRKSFLNRALYAREEIVTLHFVDGIYNMPKKWTDRWLMPGTRSYDCKIAEFTDIFTSIYYGTGILRVIKMFDLDIYKTYCVSEISKWPDYGQLFVAIFGDLFDYEINSKQLKIVMGNIIKMPQCKDTHSIEPEIGKVDISMPYFWYTLRTVWPSIIDDLFKYYNIDLPEIVVIYKDTIWPRVHV